MFGISNFFWPRSCKYAQLPTVEDALEEAPPAYSVIDPAPQPSRAIISTQDPGVARLRRFLVWRMAIDWRLKGQVSKSDKPDRQEYEYFERLCKDYCRLLGMQFSSRVEIERVKQELIEAVFKPAKMLGLSADLMEFFLFSVRTITKAGNNMSNRVDYMTLSRIVLDHSILVQVATEDAVFARKLKANCLKLHQNTFPWQLALELLNLGSATQMRPPSLSDPNSELGYWPNMIHLSKECQRPSVALMDPTASSSYNVHILSFLRSYRQPEVREYFVLSWSGSRASSVVVGSNIWMNPEGSSPCMAAVYNGYYRTSEDKTTQI